MRPTGERTELVLRADRTLWLLRSLCSSSERAELFLRADLFFFHHLNMFMSMALLSGSSINSLTSEAVNF